jgi:uncharacterized protein (DUF362 family)
MSNVAKIKVKDNLKEAILEAVNSIGGFGKFVETGDTVLLKPNFNTADPFPASTDPEFLKAVVELVYDYGAKLVMIGESSTMTLNTRKVMEKLGIFDLLKMKLSPRIYVFEEGEWIKKEIPNGKYLKGVSVPILLDKVDKLILLPCLKTHCYAQFTGALKLAIGFMKPSQRVSLHLRHLQEKIAELNKIINPNLIIMDGRKCFINKGPSEGELREPNLILASANRVSIDIEGIKIIQSYKDNSLAGIDPRQLPQIKYAVEIGVKN